MFILQIILGYIIIHIISVIYMFNMFDSQGYVADEFDRWFVWLFAPQIIVITFIRAIGGNRQ